MVHACVAFTDHPYFYQTGTLWSRHSIHTNPVTVCISSIQTHDVTRLPVTVYRPTLSEYKDTGHDTPPCHSIQTHPVTV